MHTALEQQHAAAPSAIHGFLTRIVDITMIALGAAAAAWFSPGDGIDPSDNMAIVASTAVFAMILFPAFGVARIPRDRATCRIVFLTVSAWLLALAGSAIVMFAMRGALPVPPSGFLLWGTASGIALVAFRLAVCATLERIVQVGERTRPVAIVGGGAHCAAVLERIAQSPSTRYRAAALLDPDRCAQPGANGIEAFSTLDAFAAHVRANTIPEVWIALPITETSAIVRMLDTLRHDLVDAQLFDLSDSSVRDRCGGQARRATRRSPHVGGYRRHVHRAGRGLPVRLRLSCLDRAADADGAEPEIPACTRHGRAVGVMAGRRWHAP